MRAISKTVAVLTAVLMSLTVFCVVSHAGPAMPWGFEMSQPDGTRFKAHKRGDEFQGWVETTDGYTIVKDKAGGRWEYAKPGPDGKPVPSGKAVGPATSPPKGTPPGIRPPRNTEAERRLKEMIIDKRQQRQSGGASVQMSPSSSGLSTSGTIYLSGGNKWPPVPVSGDFNLLIVLVGFADRSLTTTPADWNATIFDTTPGAPSLKNYYLDNSFNALNIVPVSHTQAGSPPGIVVVNIASDHPNYGGNISYNAEVPWLNEALAAASDYVDFRSYDTSGDGYFQDSEMVVYFVPAGYEASGTAKTPSIWAHSMSAAGALTANGMSFNTWALNGELNNYDHQHPMGVIAHELGHSMGGLPDLYDTSFVNEGMGAYSLMAAGSWGRRYTEHYDSGNLPVSLDAWCREYLGWSAPRVPSSAGTYNFPAALSATDSPLKLINTDIDPTEYFLVENRYSTGWDLGLEAWLGQNWGGGLLIQHIDTTVGTPGYNDINCYDPDGKQGVLVVEANTSSGSLMNNTSQGNVKHLYFDTNNDSFTSTSTPNSLLYDGADTGLSLTSISAKSDNMSGYVDGTFISFITFPYDGASYLGMNRTITGVATGGLGVGISLVEISLNGGPWIPATGTNSWTYDWTAPGPGLYNIRCRATDTNSNVEVPGSGVTVYIKAQAFPQRTHYNWDWWLMRGDCTDCHQTAQTFLSAGYKDSESFCYSCHNAASAGHGRSIGLPGHGVMASITSAGITTPTYGNFTGESDNRPYAHLPGGMVTCVTCHNIMQNPEDVARKWELTSTTDNLTYTMQNGGWEESGYYEPKVYRDTSLWSGPGMVIDTGKYLVDPSEYAYDATAGTITFRSAQDPAVYIYVTLDFPSLRVSTLGDRLCSDCHPQQTHMGANCLVCHRAHGTGNIALIGERVTLPNWSTANTVFTSLTGSSSFADGDGTYDGVCEVCHTTTKYYRNDGSGFANHSGGFNYDRKDCTACHTHASGFAK